MIDHKKIRSDFPILESTVYGRPLVYLDNAATTQKPDVVLKSILDFYSTSNGNIHRGIHYLSEKASDAYESARETVKKFINARSVSEIIFTSGATSSINLIASSFGALGIKSGDEIIVSGLEHHSNLIPWQLLCQRSGATLRIIPLDSDGNILIDQLCSLVSEKAKLLSVTYVSNVTGAVTPIEKIISIARQFEIPVLIDGAQAVQHMPIDVQKLGCDFFVFSGHKIYAETGIGVLYGKESYLDRMPPWQTGGGMIASVDYTKTSFSDLPFKFEAGTPNIAGAISLGEALKYVNSIGIENIAVYEHELMSYTEHKLYGIEGVNIYGKPSLRVGAISFNVGTYAAYDVCEILDKAGIALRSGTHCAEPLMKHFGVRGTVRASLAMYNTRDEIDCLVNGIKKVQSMLC